MVKAGNESPIVGEIVPFAILCAITIYLSLADALALLLYVAIFIILPIDIIVDSYPHYHFTNLQIVLLICSNFSIFFFTFGLVDTMMKTGHFGIIGDSATYLYQGIRNLVELPIQSVKQFIVMIVTSSFRDN